jgi:3-oxoacyl-[acyl-carrier protein] reductase
MSDAHRLTDFDSLKVGDRAVVRRTFSAELVKAFAQLTGDDNPLHVDEAFARQTAFGRPVAHGMLSAAIISSVIGTQLPGPGSLWFQQQFDFLLPVFVGDEVEFSVQIEHKSLATRTLVVSVEGRNAGGQLVLKGQGKVMMPEEKSTTPRTGQSEDRVALVTGGSRGIGAAISLALGLNGVAVVVNYRESADRANSIVGAITQRGGKAMALKADVSDAAAVAALVADAEAKFGRPIGILVNNAGGPTVQKPFLNHDWEDFERHLAVQLRGALNCCKAVAPGMLKARRGEIINIGSTYTWSTPPANLSGYITAKAALAAMTRAAAVELGPQGIRVNMISPGMTETDLIADVPERMRKVFAQQNPLRRLAMPDDVAQAVLMLCSPAGAYVNGAEIPVSGGSVM